MDKANSEFDVPYQVVVDIGEWDISQQMATI